MSSRQNPLHVSSCYCYCYCDRSWGSPIAFQCFSTSLTKNSDNTKVVFNHFDRDSCMYVYIYILLL